MKPNSLAMLASMCLAMQAVAQEPNHPAMTSPEVQGAYGTPSVDIQTLPMDAGHRFQMTRVDSATLADVVNAWTGKPRELADELIEKYGAPNEAEEGYLIWHNNGIWRMTMLEYIQPTAYFPDSDSGILYQSINYHVPKDRSDNLSYVPDNVILDSARGTIGARGGSEAENLRSIQRADDIIHRGGASLSQGDDWPRDARDEAMEPDYGRSIAYPNGRTPVPDYSKPYDPDEDEELKAKKAEQREKCKKHWMLSRHGDMDWEYCPDHWGNW